MVQLNFMLFLWTILAASHCQTLQLCQHHPLRLHSPGLSLEPFLLVILGTLSECCNFRRRMFALGSLIST